MFQTIFYQPVLNLIVFLYDIIPGNDLAIAIILFTIIIKLILLPLSRKSIKAQKALQDLQPKMEEIKQKYKDNKEEMSKAMLELYRENKVNPFGSCLPILIQLPFLWAVFRVFRDGFNNGTLDLVYPFITRPETINTMALGFIDLASPNVFLAVAAGLAQFWQVKMMSTKKPPVKSEGAKDENMMAMMNKQMMYMMPVLTVFIGLTLPGGLTLYWFITTVLTAVQQIYVFKDQDKDKNKKDDSGKDQAIEGEVVK